MSFSMIICSDAMVVVVVVKLRPPCHHATGVNMQLVWIYMYISLGVTRTISFLQINKFP